MIDPLARKQARRALEQFLSGATTNRTYIQQYPYLGRYWLRHRDRALVALYTMTWNFYDDFEEHRLEGSFALPDEGRQLAARCLLFLATTLEYEWRIKDFMRIDWRTRIPFLRRRPAPAHATRLERTLREPAGDATLWPFYRASDYEAALAQCDEEVTAQKK